MDNSPRTLKRRVFELVEVTTDEQGTNRFDWFDVSIAVLIVLNVLTVMLETVPAMEARYGRWFDGFEAFSVAVFGIEYVLRVWCCTVLPEYRHPLLGRLRYASRPLLLIDLLAILPSLLPVIIDLRFLRALRLLRILRVLKLGRYSAAAALLGRVLRGKREELAVMLLATVVLLIVSSGVMYYAEHEAQPQTFSSIPAAMWWAVITLTTIGYGDVYPVTVLGRILGGMIAVSGIGIVALPTAIVASGFAEEVKHRREREKGTAGSGPKRCPHCGTSLE